MSRFAIALSLLSASTTVETKSFDPPASGVAETCILLSTALNAAAAQGEAENQLRHLEAAVSNAISQLQPHSPVRDRLEAALREESRDPGKQLAALRQSISRAVKELSFTPRAEAELPKGFPTYTPVGTIEVKQYPQYRKATAGGFWTLFMHIKLNGIKMTAPVEMAYATDESDQVEEKQMSFLYGDAELGTPGRQGKVTVTDNEPQTVVAIGMRGKRDTKVVAAAERRLRRWLDDAPHYAADGELRVMGYYSPYVAQEQAYV